LETVLKNAATKVSAADFIPLASLAGKRRLDLARALDQIGVQSPGLVAEIHACAGACTVTGALLARLGLPASPEAELNGVPVEFRDPVLVLLDDAVDVLSAILTERHRRRIECETALRAPWERKRADARAAAERAIVDSAKDIAEAKWTALAQPAQMVLTVAAKLPPGEIQNAFIELAAVMATGARAFPCPQVITTPIEAAVSRLTDNHRAKDICMAAEERSRRAKIDIARDDELQAAGL
jgi:hypothetical protein